MATRSEWVRTAYIRAVERVERARRLRRTELDLRGRASLEKLPPLDHLEQVTRIFIGRTHVRDISELSKLPYLEYVDVSQTPVSDLTPLSRAVKLRALHIGWSRVSDLNPLASLESLETLHVYSFQGNDITPLANLRALKNLVINSHQISDGSPVSGLQNLRGLDLSYCNFSDFRFLEHLTELVSLNLSHTPIVDLSPLSQLEKLETLALNRTACANLGPLSKLPKLKTLILSYSNVADLSPIARLKTLNSLHLMGTKVEDLTPVKGLTNIGRLDLDHTPVTDLAPLARLTKLVDGASRYGGLDDTGCPLADGELLRFASLSNPDRTVKTINHLRSQQGLPLYAPGQSEEEAEPPEEETQNLEALKGVPAPFSFALTETGTISVSANSADWPTLPLETSEIDHLRRLEACRAIATDIIEQLDAGNFQVRRDYSTQLKKYGERLPTEPGSGNILLADAAARTIRNLFGAEAEILSPAFASSLKTFLEQHMGLRVFYPEISAFYSDVQDGKLSKPLPLDAVDDFVQGIKKYTPTVFEPNVVEAIGEANDPPAPSPDQGAIRAELKPTDIAPPPDPLGEVDPKKSHDFAMAGTINRLWDIFRAGEKINSSIDAWVSAGQKLGPAAKAILKWLYEYLQSGNHPLH